MGDLKERIREHEGLSLHPYTDTTGNMTIGWGRNLTEKGISLEEADAMLDNDIEMAKLQYEGLPREIRVQCNNIRRDVIIEMLFQIGLVGTLKFRKMFAALERGDYSRAADEMEDSLWAKQTPARCRGASERMRHGHT